MRSLTNFALNVVAIAIAFWVVVGIIPGIYITPDKLGNFIEFLLIGKCHNGCFSYAIFVIFDNFIILISFCSHLGKMRNHDELEIIGHFLHEFSHFFGNSTGYTSINLIKNQSWQSIIFGHYFFDGEHYPGSFSTGNSILNRLQRKSGISLK